MQNWKDFCGWLYQYEHPDDPEAQAKFLEETCDIKNFATPIELGHDLMTSSWLQNISHKFYDCLVHDPIMKIRTSSDVREIHEAVRDYMTWFVVCIDSIQQLMFLECPGSDKSGMKLFPVSEADQKGIRGLNPIRLGDPFHMKIELDEVAGVRVVNAADTLLYRIFENTTDARSGLHYIVDTAKIVSFDYVSPLALLWNYGINIDKHAPRALIKMLPDGRKYRFTQFESLLYTAVRSGFPDIARNIYQIFYGGGEPGWATSHNYNIIFDCLTVYWGFF